jgi:hypothetical protein
VVKPVNHPRQTEPQTHQEQEKFFHEEAHPLLVSPSPLAPG